MTCNLKNSSHCNLNCSLKSKTYILGTHSGNCRSILHNRHSHHIQYIHDISRTTNLQSTSNSYRYSQNILNNLYKNPCNLLCNYDSHCNSSWYMHYYSSCSP